MFQFQYGAIRSNEEVITSVLVATGFNSSMVRLGAVFLAKIKS